MRKGVDLDDFDTGFTITLDSNKNWIRNPSVKVNYYYFLSFIFTEKYYYVFKQLSNDSFVLAKSEEIPFNNFKNKGLIDQVFQIKGSIVCSHFIVVKLFDKYDGQKYASFYVYLLSSEQKWETYLLHNQKKPEYRHLTPLNKQKTSNNIQIGGLQYQDIKGCIRTNIAYIIYNNYLIDLNIDKNINEIIEENKVTIH